jgi:hypothetical protein
MRNGRPKIRWQDLVIVLMPPAAALTLCLMASGIVRIPGCWVIDNAIGWYDGFTDNSISRGWPPRAQNLGWNAGRECLGRLVELFPSETETPLIHAVPQRPAGLFPVAGSDSKRL